MGTEDRDKVQMVGVVLRRGGPLSYSLRAKRFFPGEAQKVTLAEAEVLAATGMFEPESPADGGFVRVPASSEQGFGQDMRATRTVVTIEKDASGRSALHSQQVVVGVDGSKVESPVEEVPYQEPEDEPQEEDLTGSIETAGARVAEAEAKAEEAAQSVSEKPKEAPKKELTLQHGVKTPAGGATAEKPVKDKGPAVQV